MNQKVDKKSVDRKIPSLPIFAQGLKAKRYYQGFLSLIATSLLFCSNAYATRLALESEFPNVVEVQQDIEVGHGLDLVTSANEDQAFDFFSYDFGLVFVNSRHYVRYIVTNTSNGPLTFLKATISGFDFDGFHDCTKGLAIGEKCWFEIQYSPMRAGMSIGRFTLAFKEGKGIIVNARGHARDF